MKKILIIDDSPFMRLILKKIFKKEDYQFLESPGGLEAYELYKQENPDCVLLDIVMPKVQGPEILKKIKKYDPKAKIIMITAVGRENVMEKCADLGAIDYITKPFEEDRVREAVEQCLG